MLDYQRYASRLSYPNQALASTDSVAKAYSSLDRFAYWSPIASELFSLRSPLARQLHNLVYQNRHRDYPGFDHQS